MGGKAFTSGLEPLLTPRMPPEMYHLVKKHIHSLLSKHFEHVGTPIEAPGKTDYGDIDFLVANPISDLPEPRVESLAKILGATKWEAGKPETNFAWPYSNLPKTEHSKDLSETEDSKNLPETLTKDKFVQVDVITCETTADFNWQLFLYAHGDFWSIMGSMLRKLGLATNTRGLHIRIESIEKFNKNKALVFLSSNPDQVLDFLGLEKLKYWRPFDSVDDMFKYITTCRLFYIIKEDETKALDARDKKKRLKNRAVFQRYILEFLPNLKATMEGKEPESRGTVLEEAFETFGTAPKIEYHAKLKEWEKEQQVIKIIEAVKDAVPPVAKDEDGKNTKEWSFRCAAIRGLKDIIFDGNEEHGVVMEEGIVGEDGMWDLDKLRDFVQRNWKAVGESQCSKDMRKRKENEKLQKEEAEAARALKNLQLADS